MNRWAEMTRWDQTINQGGNATMFSVSFVIVIIIIKITEK